jgi:hypothetical protein
MKSWVLKGLVPAVAAMLSMSAFVAMAGPGGFVDVSDDGGSEPDVGESGGEAGDEGDCFLTILSDGANAYIVLQEHVSDAEMPEGGVAGNQNALDRICFGTLHGPPDHTTQVPGHSGDAPGHSGDAPGQSGDAPGKSGDAPGTGGDGADALDNGPGKSEDAPGEPAAPGKALGKGQEKADAMGLGPSEAPGQNKP